ncbi:SDR family oxidoreductase [Ectopseudomonas guguanensis]|jgi:short-subunit dehydrogenase|uniref:SDR family oxidoreductase n=1 Tax=Ectopseudomonas guguanensis TaxID=1198456 RepID=UPI0012D63F1D|nr:MULTISPECIES: SDR family oxidoreductase [Pseudomonas]MPT18340.1 SDR family oxidoreductase [Pseudomonas sp.]WJH58209.1 SDR family oxidoreductase [Pseudomonas guguanensis]
MQPTDCRALLTGASGGIGLALAQSLASAGAHLLLVGRRLEPLQPLLQRYPDQIQLVQADIASRTGRDTLVAAAQNFGGLNCLINAAGVNRFALLDQHDEQQLAELIGLNVTATLQLTQRLLPLLRAQRRALVINLGSTFGAIGYPGFAAYCASKFALRGFSEALRRELADTNVRVLYFAPRATRTAMNAPSVVAMNDELGVAMDNPERVAAELLQAIRLEQEERHLGWPERLFVRLNGLLPRVVDQALRKQLPIIQRFARHKH